MKANYLELSMETPETGEFEENIRVLRTNLQLSGSNIRTILFTSVEPNDGKSFVSFSLARALAQLGKRVCYVDSDIRNSVFVQRHGVHAKTQGLSQILSGQLEPERGVYTSNIQNLDVVLAGPYSPNAAELLEDAMCACFFDYLKAQTYDYIIVDSAPVGAVIDAAVLSAQTDGIVLVVRSEVTKKKQLAQAKKQLDKTGVRLLGVVLNQVKGGNSYYGGYYGYGYGGKDYGYGGERTEQTGNSYGRGGERAEQTGSSYGRGGERAEQTGNSYGRGSKRAARSRKI